MEENIQINSIIKIPFENNRLAELSYDVLRIDKEPKRSEVTKTLSVKDNNLEAVFEAETARQLRVAVNGFLGKIDLIAGTVDLLGPPVSEKYSHY